MYSLYESRNLFIETITNLGIERASGIVCCYGFVYVDNQVRIFFSIVVNLIGRRSLLGEYDLDILPIPPILVC